MYNNILVGYDGSEPSTAALVEALHWGKTHNGKVNMVLSVFFDSEEFNTSSGQLDERLEKGRAVCFETKEKFSSEFGMDIGCQVIQGEPHEAIPKAAAEQDADLIALGTYGRKGIKRMIMGSVTSGVIMESHCDVLVVKKPCDKCTGKYSSILVPYDGSAPAQSALMRAAELSRQSNASVTLLYIIPRYEEMVGFIKTESIREKMYEEARKIVLKGETLVRDSGISINTMINEGNTVAKILEISQGLGNDIIVMGSHGWSGVEKAIMGSTAERVITHATTPVLVVRPR